jgi:anti-sigma-K factor RskA
MAWVLRAAAVLAVVVLGGWNLLLQGRLDASEAYNRDVAAVLDVAAQPGAMTAILAPQAPNGPRGIAALTPSGALTLAVRDLGPTSGTQVYETWAIVGDEAPVALGGFTVGAAGTGRFDGDNVPAQAGLTVALTLEPAAGATAPSSSPVAAGSMTAPPGAEALTATLVAAAPASLVSMDAHAIVRP